MSRSSIQQENVARQWLVALDPRLKLGVLFWISTLGVVLDGRVALAALAVVSLLLVAGLRLAPRTGLLLLGLVLAVAWGTMLSQAMFYAATPRTTLLVLLPSFELSGLQFDGLRLYREGAAHGAVQSLRLVAVLLAGLAVCWSTGPERLLAALVRLRMNVALAFMTVTALRFLPTLIEQWQTIRLARRLRAPGRAASMTWRPREFLAMLSTLFSAMLRRATTLAGSVAARGFDPMAQRTFYPPLRMRPWEHGLVALLAFSWGAIMAAKALYFAYLADFYYHPAMRGLYDFTRQWL